MSGTTIAADDRLAAAITEVMQDTDRLWGISALVRAVGQHAGYGVFMSGRLWAPTFTARVGAVWQLLDAYAGMGLVQRFESTNGHYFWQWVGPVPDEDGAYEIELSGWELVMWRSRQAMAWVRERARRVVVAVAVVVCAVVVTWVAAADMAARPEDGTRSPGDAGPVPMVALPTFEGGECQEDEPCFNSCAMGLDGTKPVGDPRRALPGPCTFHDAVLPAGRSFVVDFVPLDVDGPDVCAGVGAPAGWRYASVTVSVADESGATVAGSAVTADMCVPGWDDEVAAGVGEVMPELYRMAAAPELYRR